MALKSLYNPKVALAELQALQEIEYLMLLKDLIVEGNRFTKEAVSQVQDHSKNTYIDDTGDLRRSIAIYIFRNGTLIYTNERGNAQENRQIIADEVVLTNNGFDMVAIAGMIYASWVESKGYNVITNQGEKLLIDLSKLIANMRRKGNLLTNR